MRPQPQQYFRLHSSKHHDMPSFAACVALNSNVMMAATYQWHQLKCTRTGWTLVVFSIRIISQFFRRYKWKSHTDGKTDIMTVKSKQANGKPSHTSLVIHTNFFLMFQCDFYDASIENSLNEQTSSSLTPWQRTYSISNSNSVAK